MSLKPSQTRNYRMMVSLVHFKTLNTIIRNFNTMSMMIILIKIRPSFLSGLQTAFRPQ